MKINKTKHALKEGKTALGTMVSEFRMPEIGRMMAAAGFDFMIIDNEHSPHSYETDMDVIRAGRASDIDCFVRVPDALYTLIARTLDIGAEGVMVPRVETRETVEEVVGAVKYPPWGRRGWGVRSMHTDFEQVSVKEGVAYLNDNTLVIIQIESQRAIDHIDELVSVKGVDVALIGPNDLSISLGVPGELSHPKMVAQIERMVAGCERNGVAAGIHIRDMDALKMWKDKGMRCLMFSSDSGFLMSAASASAQELRAYME